MSAATFPDIESLSGLSPAWGRETVDMWMRRLCASTVVALGVGVPLACEAKAPAASPAGRRAATQEGARLSAPDRPLRPSADLAAFVNDRPDGQALVTRGERWAYALRWSRLPEAQWTDLERGLILFGRGATDGERIETITSVGVREVHFDRVNPGETYGSPDEWRFRPELTATSRVRPPYVSATRETLSVSGRRLPCVVLGSKQSNGRVDRLWIHVGDGDVVLFPGVVKQESAGSGSTSIQTAWRSFPAPSAGSARASSSKSSSASRARRPFGRGVKAAALLTRNQR